MRILVAEDNPVNLEIILYMLEGKGETDVAVNGKEAVERSRTVKYDIIFMDVQMPVMNGLEASAAIKREGYEGIIVAMTANALNGDKEKCIAAGMDEYISKPLNIGDVDAVIEKKRLRKINDMLSDNEAILDKNIVDTLREINKAKPMFIDKIYNMFFKETEAYIKIIEDKIAESEIEEAAKAVHKIKGSATSVGAMQIGTLCERWEEDYKEGKYSNGQRFIIKLKEQYEAVKHKILNDIL